MVGQEAKIDLGGAYPVQVPYFMAEIVEEIAFQARDDNRVDKQSGVSQRLPISLLELLVSNAKGCNAPMGHTDSQ